MSLEHEVDVGAKAYSLSIWQGQQVIIIEDGVEGLNPLRVDITIINKPRLHLRKVKRKISTLLKGAVPVTLGML